MTHTGFIGVFVWNIIMFLCAVGPLIVLHELGHYLAGRYFGVQALTFSIGFGRTLFSFTDKHGTNWRVAALPLGGYVRFAGNYDEGGAPLPDQPEDCLELKPLWQRAIVALAGPLVNFLVGWIIICGFLMAYGAPQITNKIDTVVTASPAALGGLRTGDQITAINGVQTDAYNSIREIVVRHAGQALNVHVIRTGQNGRPQALDLSITPIMHTLSDETGHVLQGGFLGIVPTVENTTLHWFEVPWHGFKLVGSMIVMIGVQIEKIFTGVVPLTVLHGPIKTAEIAGQVAHAGWLPFLEFIALISINLGFMNLLPLPILDGGHLMLYAVQAIRRKPLDAKTRTRVFTAGFVLLLMLFAVVTFNDL